MVSVKLMELGISANVIAGYYHDHIFVQTEYAEKALIGLLELSKSSERLKLIIRDTSIAIEQIMSLSSF